MKELFTIDLPLTQLPPPFLAGLELNINQFSPNHPTRKVIDHILVDLDIKDPFVRLLLTIGLILSSKNPIPAATDCKTDKIWGTSVKSSRPKWLCAFVFNGLWYGREEVHTSTPDIPKYSVFNKGFIGLFPLIYSNS
jgi:hypothetical protein